MDWEYYEDNGLGRFVCDEFYGEDHGTIASFATVRGCDSQGEPDEQCIVFLYNSERDERFEISAEAIVNIADDLQEKFRV